MTYLTNYEPKELVHVSGNTYCTREHDSLRISNGKWYWFSHDIGGRSALDYLIKVKDYSFKDAVAAILGKASVKEPIPYHQKEQKSPVFLMPELDDNTKLVEKYLYSRGIHSVITKYCIEKKLFDAFPQHGKLKLYKLTSKRRYNVFHRFGRGIYRLSSEWFKACKKYLFHRKTVRPGHILNCVFSSIRIYYTI